MHFILCREGLCCGIAVAALACALPASAQEELAPEPAPASEDALKNLALRDALVLAYDHNPSLEGQRAQLEAADQRFVQAQAAYGPTLTAQGDYGYAKDRFGQTPNVFNPARNQYLSGWSGSADLVLNQPLYTSGRLRASENQALNNVKAGIQNVRSAEIQTMLNTISAYTNVLLRRDLLRITYDNKANLDRQRSDGTARFSVREITLTDLEQIKTQSELANARVDIARGSLISSESEFLRVIGAVPHELAPLPPLPPVPESLEEAYALAEATNPTLLAARAQERSSRAVIDRVVGENGPQVNLQGRISYGATTQYNNFENTQTLVRGTVNVTMPIFTSGLNEAREAEARALNDADWRNADQTLRDVRQAVADSWASLASQTLSIASFERSVEAAQQAYEGAVIQQRAGDRSTQDVLILARDLLDARSNLASARANEYVAKARLLAVIGQLELSSLVPNAAYYDPYEEFRKIKREGSYPLPHTPYIRQLDSIGVDKTNKDRKPRDPARGLTLPAEIAVDETAPQ